jgi:1,4-dihydroxy-2-naphthoate octaprenyltransferase
MATSQISLVFQSFRPKTLSAAVVPVVVGSVASFTLFREFNPLVFWCCLLGALFIQIGTNLANDAADFVKGADGDDRKGPLRLSQSKAFKASTVMGMATFFFALALLVGIPLVQIGGPILAVLGLISVALGYAYTSGPYPLAYNGLGDFFVVAFFGVIAVMTTVYLHSGFWTPEGLVLGLQVGFLSATLIAINNLRDIFEDKKIGKRTMAVRLGVKGARWKIAIYFYLPYFLCTYWLIPHYGHAAVLPFFALFVSIPVVNKIFATEPSPEYNKFLAQASLHTFVFCLLLMIGLYIA